VINHLLT